MGTRGLFIFRNRHKKVVLQLMMSSDAYPEGFPKEVAEMLASFAQSVDCLQNVSFMILKILDKLKTSVGSIYIRPFDTPYDAITNYPFMEHCYIVDFYDDKIVVDWHELCGEYWEGGPYEFAIKCGIHYKCQIFKGIVPRKADTDRDQEELVMMFDQNGKAFFLLMACGWQNKVGDYVLNLKMCDGIRGDAILGKVANGADCMAAQILKETFAQCPDADILPLDESHRILHSGRTVHKISFYPAMGCAIHDKNNCLQGIHTTRWEQEKSLRLASQSFDMEFPREPPVQQYYEPDKVPINTPIIVEKFDRDSYDKDFGEPPKIFKGDKGILLFRHDVRCDEEQQYTFFFDTNGYRGELKTDRTVLRFVFDAEEAKRQFERLCV